MPPTIIQPPRDLTEQQIARFWNRVDKRTPDECWVWKGYCTKQGYGYVGFWHVVYRTHVIAWYLSIGRWPFGLNVLHTCDNPPCCNPNHLFEDTDLANQLDCIAKGRHNDSVRGGRGSRNGAAKLQDADVLEIRRLGDIIGPTEVAKYPCSKGVNVSVIARILRRETWKHLL